MSHQCGAGFEVIRRAISRSVMTIGVVIVCTTVLRAQPVSPQEPGVDSYRHNRAQEGTPAHDVDLGEFYVDFGGHIPFEDLEALYSGMEDDFLEYMNDLESLDAAVRSGVGGSGPYFIDLLEDDDTASISLENSYSMDPWWVSGSGDYVDVEEYFINGGYVQIARRFDPPELQTVHTLFYTKVSHQLDMQSPGFVTLFEIDPNLDWTNGGETLTVHERALEHGDVVVYVQENLTQSFWIQFQRLQEAEHFLRTTWLVDHLSGTDSDVGMSFVSGDSWGGLVSAILALWQPHIYRGSGGNLGNDVGLMQQGDYRALRAHRECGLNAGWAGPFGGFWPVASRDKLIMYPAIDILGIRFDDPKFGNYGWEFAAMSLTHRRDDLKVPIQGAVGTSDDLNNFHWSIRDVSLAAGDLYQPTNLMNTGHGGTLNQEAGKNEYWFFDEDVWENTLLPEAPTSQPSANPMIPTDDPDPVKVYPDPYTHTLRFTECIGPAPVGAEDFLTPIDLMPDDLAEESADEDIQTVGQGTWIGFGDTMEIDDLDDDGLPELFFGNFEGFCAPRRCGKEVAMTT